MIDPTDLPESVRIAAAALGARATRWQAPDFGLSSAERWVASLDTGTSVFVKGATDRDTARWLRNEYRALCAVGDRFGPRMIAWIDDSDRPVLVTEDLSDAYWPARTGTTIWRVGDIDTVIATLDGLRVLQPPSSLSPVEWPRPAWANLIESQTLSNAGICSTAWLKRNGPAIADAEERAEPGGDSLVHGDVRSDNLCLLQDGGVRLVDWSQAGIGSPAHDRILLLPTLRLEGGPPPATILAEPVDLIARLSGSTVRRAVSGRPMPEWLRDVFRRLALIDLEWLVDILDLEPLDSESPSGN
jgi:hypothetical protein